MVVAIDGAMDVAAADALADSMAAGADSVAKPEVSLTDVVAADLPAGDSASFDAPPVPSDGAQITPCGELKRLADLGVVTKQRTCEVTFAPDRSWVVLRVQPDAVPTPGRPDQLLRVALPSGEIATVSNSGGRAEALGRRGGLLVYGLGSDGKDLAVYEQGALRILASGTCQHLASPGGERVYFIRDCPISYRGTLAVVDVATGISKTLATDVIWETYWGPSYTVSASENYFAFLVQSSGGATSLVLHVADREGRVYAVNSQPGATAPWFASDDLLLFGASRYPSAEGSLRAHVPGSGDTSYVLTTAGRADGLFGYKISSDKRWMLGAGELVTDAGYGMKALLYAIRLDGKGEKLLSSNLSPYWMNQLAIDAFAWSGDGHAIYVGDRSTSIWASDPAGGVEEQISPGPSFRPAPVGDRVALVENTGDVRRNRLRMTALGSGQDLASFASDGSIGAITFMPDGRGLVFLDSTASGVEQLRYLSPSTAGSTVLGEWKQTLLDSYRYPSPYGQTNSYPVDPTGCFTVVDTDRAPGPGTRLVLMPE